jgi:hypothetical protein
MSSLPAHEVEAVVMLAWIRVCQARASKATKYYSVSGRDGSIDRSSMVGTNLEMARQLREDYVTLCTRLGINPAPEIIVSEFEKFDDSLHAMTPVETHEPPESCNLSITSYGGEEVVLQWTESQPRNTFTFYQLFVGTEAGLQDFSNLGDTSGVRHFGLNESKATMLKIYRDHWRTSCKIENLDPSETYYFVLKLVDCNGRFSLSNEIVVGSENAEIVEDSLRYANFTLSGVLLTSTDYITDVSFTDQMKIEQVSVSLATAPTTEPLEVVVANALNGENITVTVPVGVTVASADAQNLIITASQSLNISTGLTVGGSASAVVRIGYRLDVKTLNIYDEDNDHEYRVTVDGTIDAEHLTIERRE